jgi:hypothetical protein
MNVIVKTPEIKSVQFIGNSAMLLFLTNDRTLIIPLDKFKEIASLSPAEKGDFEVIDGENLSFLALDEIYNIHDLIGL